MKLWQYRFTRPDGSEVATPELPDDAAAETLARELSVAEGIPVVIHRHSAHVDSWEYVTEADGR